MIVLELALEEIREIRSRRIRQLLGGCDDLVADCDFVLAGRDHAGYFRARIARQWAEMGGAS